MNTLLMYHQWVDETTGLYPPCYADPYYIPSPPRRGNGERPVDRGLGRGLGRGFYLDEEERDLRVNRRRAVSMLGQIKEAERQLLGTTSRDSTSRGRRTKKTERTVCKC